jgi:hypothetical protein
MLDRVIAFSRTRELERRKCIELIALLSVAFSAACATPPVVSDASEWPVDRSMIVGRVRFVIEGETKSVPGNRGPLWSGAHHGTYWILLHRKGEERALPYQLKDDGFFFWALEPGAYRIVAIERQIDQDDFILMEFGAELSVPAARRDFYLPTMDLVIHGSSYGFNLTEEPEAAEAAARGKYDARAQPLARLGLVIPTEIGRVGSVVSACSSDWKRGCTRTRRGVSPVSPPISGTRVAFGGSPFTEIATLVPNFSWQGSHDAGIEYDLIVYEALSYMTRLGIERFSVGKVVLYEESISGTSFRVPDPLEPSTRYFWSVRYRKGTTVSEWSTYSYAMGLPLVWWSSAGGYRYGFQTGG